MKSNYKLIVFDWDGTLKDSISQISNCIRLSFKASGLPVPSEKQSRYVIGLGLRDTMNFLKPGIRDEEIDLVAENYRKFFLANDNPSELFPNVKAGLAELVKKNFKIAISTGKTAIGLERELRQHELTNFFHATRCADQDKPKPNPSMLIWLMNKLGVTRTETLMVGDTSHDILMAKSAGVDVVGVSYGAHSRSKLEASRPLEIFDADEELFEWVLN